MRSYLVVRGRFYQSESHPWRVFQLKKDAITALKNAGFKRQTYSTGCPLYLDEEKECWYRIEEVEFVKKKK